MKIIDTKTDPLLLELVKLRKKCKKTKDNQLHNEYKKIQSLCAQKFEYLIEIRTSRYKRFSNYDDLKQDGRLGLIMALHSYDPKKGDFIWWANKYINTKVSRAANCHSTIKIPIQKTKDMQPYKVSTIPLIIDSGPTAFDDLDNSRIKEKIHAAIASLPDDQKKVIELNGIKSYSISQIAKTLNISRVHCVKLLNEAKENLKKSLKEIDF